MAWLKSLQVISSHYTPKHGRLLCLIAGLFAAGWVGFLAGQRGATTEPLVVIPANFQTTDRSEEHRRVTQLGRLQAEIIALQVLFLRLAEVANLDDGEFDLDADPFTFTKEAKTSSNAELDLLNEQIDHMNTEAAVLEKIFIERRMANDQRISGRPLAQGRRSSGYGYRKDPVTGVQSVHRGVDFIAEEGAPIYAMADGVVTFSGSNGNYGNMVEIEHGSGYRTRYAHNTTNLVGVGELVEKNQMIATLGSTGRSTGAHLHLEVRYNGRAVDPAIFIR